jgi:hypothetical protein
VRKLLPGVAVHRASRPQWKLSELLGGRGTPRPRVLRDQEPEGRGGQQRHELGDELGDALAEGSAPDATTRDWTRCDERGNGAAVICPDGYVEVN